MDAQQLQILQLKGIEYSNGSNDKPIKYLICGGGRKNNFLVQNIKDYLSNKTNISLDLIDEYNLNGDIIKVWGEQNEDGSFRYDNLPNYRYVNITYDIA